MTRSSASVRDNPPNHANEMAVLKVIKSPALINDNSAKLGSMI